MRKNRVYNKKKIYVVFFVCVLLLAGLIGRLIYLMVFQADYYSQKAKELHERERDIKAARGKILDSNNKVIAANKTVCTISVIHSQIKEPDKVIEMLVKELQITREEATKRVEKVSSIEKIKSNVEKEVGDSIRNYHLSGVKVDEDYKRYYPYQELASKVIGFTGSDNQGIVGLEVMYNKILEGVNGKILTMTDARGIELSEEGEERIEPISGYNLKVSLDLSIQEYAQQAALKVMEEKQAEAVTILLMNPQNGEIYACVNVPEYNLNEPFNLTSQTTEVQNMTAQQKQDCLNQMWRNRAINDTYEPGSTFKVFTAAAGLDSKAVSLTDSFQCGGYRLVEDRRIHCHKRAGHGSETFLQGVQNSCNPVFIDVGLRLGVDRFFDYLRQLGVLEKTGIDLPGEAGTIMHKQENVGLVELATMSFGQSFQITPIGLATMVSSVINGGDRITPHFGVEAVDDEGNVIEKFTFPVKEGVLSEETSATMRMVLESVVAEGSGKNGAVEGYRVGGKTATSQTLPRSANKYISSFVGFAPADQPQVLGLCIIYDPQGIYYGGTIAAPVMRSIFENVLPYIGLAD